MSLSNISTFSAGTYAAVQRRQPFWATLVKIRDISDLGSSVGSTCCELVQHAACLGKGCAALGNAFLHDACDAVGEILTAVLDWVGEGKA